MGIKVLLGIIASIVIVISYIPYFSDIYKNKTKPHAITWLIWTVITGVSFFAQITNQAGAGAWITGFILLLNFGIFLTAIKHGEKNVIFIDWVSLVFAIGAILLWIILNNPFISVILISIIDAIGFIPTFRKSIIKPHQETLTAYAINTFAIFISLFAISKVSILTTFYPSSIVIINIIFIFFLIIRRYQVSLDKTSQYL